MKNINLYELIIPAYWPLVDIFKNIMKNKKRNTPKFPTRFTIGGSRVSGKTMTVFILFSILYSLAYPKAFILVQVKKADQTKLLWAQLWDYIRELLDVEDKVQSARQNPMEIHFKNGSKIFIRSLLQSDNDMAALKGMPRFTNLEKAIIISEECNNFTSNKFFTPAREAVVAKEIIEFRIFNTDHINQFVVANLQEHLPESESIMKTKGNMIKIKKVNGLWQYFQRTNTLCTWDVLPNAKKEQIIADDLEDPQRGRVARWGLNGRDGKLLYYNLKNRHFINSDNLSDYKKFHKLPYQLFIKYRVGIDEGHAKDKYVLSLWGITNNGRAIWIEGWGVEPDGKKDLDINTLARESVNKLIYWSSIYQNMFNRRVNIRVEWAGNGVAVKQEMERELKNTNINYTIDKAKKSIDSKTSKAVKSNKDSQPFLEARASMKNLLLAKNKILWWNAPKEIYDEYFNRGRDEMNLIVDGNDHWGDADDYALIPEYGSMLDIMSDKTLKNELDIIIKKYNLKGDVNV